METLSVTQQANWTVGLSLHALLRVSMVKLRHRALHDVKPWLCRAKLTRSFAVQFRFPKHRRSDLEFWRDSGNPSYSNA